MIVVQGSSDPSYPPDVCFGNLSNAKSINVNGWRCRVALDHSHILESWRSAEVVIRDRPTQDKSESDQSLNGAFLLLRAGTLTQIEIVLDRVGSIPIYYATRNNHSFFSSRLLDLVRAGWQDPDPVGALQWICLGQPIGNRTPIAGVQALPNAQRIVCKPGGIPRGKRYWEIPHSLDSFGCVDKYLEQTIWTLRKAHRNAAPLDTSRLALPVTGGLDSRCNLALWAHKISDSTLFHTQDLGDFELPIAKQIAQALSKNLVVYDSTDWLLDAKALDLEMETGEFNAAHWRLVDSARRLAAEHCSTATIDGFFQDFLLKATFVRDDSLDNLISQEIKNVRYNTHTLGFKENHPVLRELEESIINCISSYGQSAWSASQNYYLENRSRRLVYNIVRLNQNHLDVRTPGMDHALMDFSFQLPKSLRTNSLLYRHVINTLAPNLAKITYDKSGLPVMDMRRRSFKRKLLWSIKRNLNHIHPNRRWLRETETNFSKLFSCDRTFRERVARDVGRSKWVRDIFGENIIVRLDTERRKGRPVDNLIGALLTFSALETQGMFK